MYYVITRTKIYKGKTTKEIDHQLNGLIEESEYCQIGADMIVNMSETDIDFVRDKKKLSTIMYGNFFKKDNTPKITGIINIILSALIFTRLMG